MLRISSIVYHVTSLSLFFSFKIPFYSVVVFTFHSVVVSNLGFSLHYLLFFFLFRIVLLSFYFILYLLLWFKSIVEIKTNSRRIGALFTNNEEILIFVLFLFLFVLKLLFFLACTECFNWLT